MNIYLTIFSCFIIGITIISFLGCAVVIVVTQDTIDEYETLGGIIKRGLNPDAQEEYENAILLQKISIVGLVLSILFGIVGSILFIIGIALPSKNESNKEVTKSGRAKATLHRETAPSNYYCQFCGKVIRYIPNKKEWYCDYCKRYIEIE